MEGNIDKVIISWTLQNVLTVFLMVSIVMVVLGFLVKMFRSVSDKKANAE